MKSNHVNLFSFPQQSALDSFIITERTLATNKDGVVSFLLFFRAWSHRQHFSFIWFIINIIFNFVALQRPTCNAVVKNHCGVCCAVCLRQKEAGRVTGGVPHHQLLI